MTIGGAAMGNRLIVSATPPGKLGRGEQGAPLRAQADLRAVLGRGDRLDHGLIETRGPKLCRARAPRSIQRPARLLDQAEPDAADRRHPAKRHPVGEVVADGHHDRFVAEGIRRKRPLRNERQRAESPSMAMMRSISSAELIRK